MTSISMDWKQILRHFSTSSSKLATMKNIRERAER